MNDVVIAIWASLFYTLRNERRNGLPIEITIIKTAAMNCQTFMGRPGESK